MNATYQSERQVLFMSNYPTAFFIANPSLFEDLMRPHLAGRRKPYVVEKMIELARIDYENFITDLTVDRWFIEKYAGLCKVDKAGVWHCILVRQRGRTDGVLVMPEGRDYPKWAAYISGD